MQHRASRKQALLGETTQPTCSSDHCAARMQVNGSDASLHAAVELNLGIGPMLGKKNENSEAANMQPSKKGVTARPKQGGGNHSKPPKS